MRSTSRTSRSSSPNADVTGVNVRDRAHPRTIAMFVIAAIVLISVPFATSRVVTTDNGTEHIFVIPAGTADRVAAGDDVAILPTDLRLAPDDRLVLINDDDATHRVASFIVGPGERVEGRFSEAATFTDYCSLHPSGSIDITVDGSVRPVDDD